MGPESQFKTAKIVRRLRTTRRTILTRVVGLKLNVVAPANTRPGSKLPVVVVCTLNGMLPPVLMVITYSAVDIWR